MRTATCVHSECLLVISCPKQRPIVGHCKSSVRVHEHDVIADTNLNIQVYYTLRYDEYRQSK